MNCITGETLYIRSMVEKLYLAKSDEQHEKYLQAILDSLRKIEAQSIALSEVFQLLGNK